MKALLLALALSGAAALADTTSCSDPAGALRLESWNYDGGAHPFHGMVVGRSTWTLRGNVIGREVRHYLADDPESIPLTVEYDEKTHVQLEHDAVSKPQGHTIWAVKTTVRKPDGAVLDPATKETRVTTYILCRRVFDTIPKP